MSLFRIVFYTLLQIIKSIQPKRSKTFERAGKTMDILFCRNSIEYLIYCRMPPAANRSKKGPMRTQDHFE